MSHRFEFKGFHNPTKVTISENGEVAQEQQQSFTPSPDEIEEYNSLVSEVCRFIVDEMTAKEDRTKDQILQEVNTILENSGIASKRVIFLMLLLDFSKSRVDELIEKKMSESPEAKFMRMLMSAMK
jgi:predicted XRE-type DNA-binding protein